MDQPVASLVSAEPQVEVPEPPRRVRSRAFSVLAVLALAWTAYVAKPILLPLCAAVLVSLWSSFNYLFVPRYGRDDTRGVVEYLRAHAGPEDLVLHINLGFSLNYYDRLTQVVRLAEPGTGDSPEAAHRYLDRILEGSPVLWYLECRPEKLDAHGYLRQACAERATAASTLQFVGIRVHRFQLR